MYVDWTFFPLQLSATSRKMCFVKSAKLEYFYIQKNYDDNNVYLENISFTLIYNKNKDVFNSSI